MKRILFIDDDPNLIGGFKRAFRKMKDWNIVYLTSPREALDRIEKEDFDAIITDYRMPGMDGIELLRRVNSIKPEVKRILLSGQSKNEVYEEAQNLVHEYISKPCELEVMIELIEKHL